MGLSRIAMSCLLMLVAILPADAQSPESYSALLTSRVKSGKLSPPAHVQDYVIDGKLHLRLQDAVRLALENNSNIRIQETQVEAQKFSLLGAYGPFDPLDPKRRECQSSVVFRLYATARCGKHQRSCEYA